MVIVVNCKNTKRIWDEFFIREKYKKNLSGYFGLQGAWIVVLVMFDKSLIWVIKLYLIAFYPNMPPLLANQEWTRTQYQFPPFSCSARRARVAQLVRATES